MHTVLMSYLVLAHLARVAAAAAAAGGSPAPRPRPQRGAAWSPLHPHHHHIHPQHGGSLPLTAHSALLLTAHCALLPLSALLSLCIWSSQPGNLVVIFSLGYDDLLK